MKFYFVFYFLLQGYVVGLCQKPPVDGHLIESWPSLKRPLISDDGNYFSYIISNQPINSQSLVVQSTSNAWQKKWISNSSGVFSGESHRFIFLARDTLNMISLGDDSVNVIPAVSDFKCSKSSVSDWLAYKVKDSAQSLILISLLDGRKMRFGGVTGYRFSNGGSGIVLLTEVIKSGRMERSLFWVSLNNSEVHLIWTSEGDPVEIEKVSSVSIGKSDSCLVFIVQKSELDNTTTNGIWYYKIGMDRAILKVSDIIIKRDKKLSIIGSPYFSRNSKWIYFEFQEQVDRRIRDVNSVGVDVWSYKDIEVQTEQSDEQKPKTYRAAIGVLDSNVVQIENGQERIIREGPDGNVILGSSGPGTTYWWSNLPKSYYLFSPDRHKSFLVKGEDYRYFFSFSPGGHYVLYFDRKMRCYFCFDIADGKTINLTRGISSAFDNEFSRNLKTISAEVGIAGWENNDSSVFVYDNYDIWQLDPLGKRKPIDITCGYGRMNHMKLRAVYGADFFQDPSEFVFDSRVPMLLTAFDVANKQNGYCRVFWKVRSKPEMLSMGSYITDMVESQTPTGLFGVRSMRPIKAGDSDCWVVQKMSATMAPNYFITTDFRKFRALTDLEPQLNYNWLKTELISWKQNDGRDQQGVLYKPEDFDSKKKYPIIFYYYECLSHQLNAFQAPDYTDSSINIPWYVSRGYLVLAADVSFTNAKTSNVTNGMNALKSVVSAARYMAKMPWVDSTKMGLNGHSFGGSETNYIVTHSHMFAAAAEASGGSDAVSSYLDPADMQLILEDGQGRMGATLWERRDLYLNSSSVLRANEVTTPLLIMHNKADPDVPWIQGVEMFMALRRLGKKAWLLQYDNYGHSLNGTASIDYTVRLTQFFDYYLKSAPAPLWMTVGIPAYLKGIETGYSLDYSGRVP